MYRNNFSGNFELRDWLAQTSVRSDNKIIFLVGFPIFFCRNYEIFMKSLAISKKNLSTKAAIKISLFV
jgi:hypothetical protein